MWEAETPHECIVIPKGNAITQKYYTGRLLSVYIDAIPRGAPSRPSFMDLTGG
jgi:hypothetical protein